MKNFVFMIAILAISVAFFACSDNAEGLQSDEAPEQPQAKSRCLTPEEAKQNVMAFLEALENATAPESRSSDHKKRVISDIQVIGGPNMSRLSDSDLVPDSSLYIFNFKDSAGFIIGGTKENQPPIYAIIDEGNYSYKMFREETNVGFKWYVSQCIDAVFKDDDMPGTPLPQPSPEWEIISVIEPMIKAKWGQGYTASSYGKLFRNYTTGCAVTATAQILYKFSTPKSVSWIDRNNKFYQLDIRWPRIKMDCNQYDGKLEPYLTPNSLNEVAYLCRYLGIKFMSNDSTYIDQTGATPVNVWNWFKYYSGLTVTERKPYKGTDIINSIKQDKVVYAMGCSDKSGEDGHAWVIDGCVDAKRHGVTEKLVHCNWGYDGKKNGYYISSVFDLNAGPIVDDNINLLGNDSYFKYKLQYFVVSSN